MARNEHTTDQDGEQRHCILDRLNANAMHVHGPGDRLAQSQEGPHMSEVVDKWYRQVQGHFHVE